ncbi:MAG: CDP-alcohol phosphatidyltransferase family protein [Limimaricola sp.]|uniref:CDP-alcohol phosphatidyltransferase family protein n=1 Tax=Limimaricola sp. TaxID=2211665 RepID=UPI001D85CD0B|nr:CDP-alcohol phosphatidyltransferase family protein [Limimaricola sp.]MBI1417295.1 CDP-alcohol phosphatidyltransferase family protein [Limimaricola sp.]
MFDAALRKMIDPPLNRLGRLLAARGAGADEITVLGLGFGVLTALCIAVGWPHLALLPLAGSRLMDGLDGAVARATRKTDFGGYLDIASDFLFYGLVPMGFVWADPAGNGAAGAFLLASFYFNGASFLGYAILAEKRGLETSAQGAKTLYYSAGLLEGSETIAFFVAICLFPGAFSALSWLFGLLCVATATLRILAAQQQFSDFERSSA